MKGDTYSMVIEANHLIQNSNKKLTYTIREVAELLNISISQAYKLANDGTLPTIKFGKRILVSIEKLERMINN